MVRYGIYYVEHKTVKNAFIATIIFNILVGLNSSKKLPD